MARPFRGTGFASHTKTLMKRVSPRNQLHPPLRGTDGAVRGESNIFELSRVATEVDEVKLGRENVSLVLSLRQRNEQELG